MCVLNNVLIYIGHLSYHLAGMFGELAQESLANKDTIYKLKLSLANYG